MTVKPRSEDNTKVRLKQRKNFKLPGSRIRRLPGLFLLICGLLLLLSPLLSGIRTMIGDFRDISGYQRTVSRMQHEGTEADRLWAKARDYNKRHAVNRIGEDQKEEDPEYDGLLNISGDGTMGILSIPRIHMTIPIGHRCTAETLETKAGHLLGSSLPVGGRGTHTVISGHRGLPSARLFTDLDQLKKGDHFSFTILNRTLTYEVDRILTVAPDDSEDLQIAPGRDYATLVTCTPYGINTRRLYVRGHRIRTPKEDDKQRNASRLSWQEVLLSLMTGWLIRDGSWKYLLMIVAGSLAIIYVTGQGRRHRRK